MVGGGCEIFTRNWGEARNKEGTGGLGTFKVLLHSWQKGANPLILWRLPYIAYPLPAFSNFVHSSPPLPCHLQPQPPLFFLLSCFFGWMGDQATFDVPWIYTCEALVPWHQKDLDVFYAKRCQVYWGLTRNVVFCWYYDTMSHTHKHTAHTAHSRASRLTQPYKYIFTPPVMCSQQLPLLR